MTDCFTKQTGGTTAYLTVTGPDDEPDDGTVQAEIIADLAGSHWC